MNEIPKNYLEQEGPERPPDDFYDCSYFLIRHGDAQYQIHKAIGQSENPEAAINHKDQDYVSDLTMEGKEKAAIKAKEFLAHFNPEKDTLYFAASNLVRARETASIYLKEAKALNFTIADARKDTEEASRIAAHQQNPEIYEALGGNKIRTLESLSLEIDNATVDWIFSPSDLLREGGEDAIAFPERISAPTQELWKRARTLIEADNKATWGQNWLAHSDEVQALFDNYQKENPDKKVPHITSAADMYHGKFTEIAKLIASTKKKLTPSEQSADGKRVRVLAFTHENPLIYFLKQEYGQDGIDKLEAIGLDVAKDGNGSLHLYASQERDAAQVKEVSLPS